MADDPDLTSRVAESLEAKGVKGECPMCGHNNWGTEKDYPFAQIKVASPDLGQLNIYAGTFPTYWMNCQNCGFLAQFVQSVVDAASEAKEAEPEP